MGSGLISIAMTGINAAQAGLLTTGNNISNLSTEGYTRQRTVQASNPSVMTGAGGIVEIQGTAEGEPFTREQMSVLVDLATLGVRHLVAAQQSALAS